MVDAAKLTKAQWATLIEVERGGDLGARYDKTYRPIIRLVEVGFVVGCGRGISSDRYTLTEAGRIALLRSIEGGERG